MAVKARQFRRFGRPVLGKEGQEPVGQRILHFAQQPFQRPRIGRRLPVMLFVIEQVVANKDGEQVP